MDPRQTESTKMVFLGAAEYQYVEILTHGFDFHLLSEVILYSCRLSGPSALSIVRSVEVVRISEIRNTLYIL